MTRTPAAPDILNWPPTESEYEDYEHDKQRELEEETSEYPAFTWERAVEVMTNG